MIVICTIRLAKIHLRQMLKGAFIIDLLEDNELEEQRLVHHGEQRHSTELRISKYSRWRKSGVVDVRKVVALPIYVEVILILSSLVVHLAVNGKINFRHSIILSTTTLKKHSRSLFLSSLVCIHLGYLWTDISGIDQASSFHLTHISLSFTVISFVPIFMLFDL